MSHLQRIARRIALTAAFAFAASPAFAQAAGVGGDLGGFIPMSTSR